MANNITISISQSQCVFYAKSNMPYSGYVKGVGYVDCLFKEYMLVPQYCGTSYVNKGCFSPYIGQIPTIDTSPAMVIRSYGDSIVPLITERIVVDRGGIIDVNLGYKKHLKLPAKNKLNVECKVVNLYQNNATLMLRVSYLDAKGTLCTEEMSSPLDGLMYCFPDIDLEGFYTPQYDTISAYHHFSSYLNVSGFNYNNRATLNDQNLVQKNQNLDLKKRESSLAGYAIGGASLTASVMEELVNNDFESRVNRIRTSQRAEIIKKIQPKYDAKFKVESKLFIDSNIKYFTDQSQPKTNWNTRFSQRELDLMKRLEYDRVMGNANRSAAMRSQLSASIQSFRETEPLYENLKNGKDPRTAKLYKTKNVLKWGGRGLNVLGLGFSGYSLYKYIDEYGSYEGEDVPFMSNPTSWRMMSDVFFSGVAFVPVYGWGISGAYFLVTTLYDTYKDWQPSEEYFEYCKHTNTD